MASLSDAFRSLEKLRLDIEHRLNQLDQRATAVTQAASQASSGGESFDRQLEESFEKQAALEIGIRESVEQLVFRVREAEGMIDKEAAVKREMWREYVVMCVRVWCMCVNV